MIVHLENCTDGAVNYKYLQSVIRVINMQIREHFAPLWGKSAYVIYRKNSDYSTNPESDAIIRLVLEMPKNPEPSATKAPASFIYLNHKDTLPPLGVLLSHEILETILDPVGNLCMVGPKYQNGRSVLYPMGMCCDPVQSQWYEIETVTVSNFVTPAYFRTRYSKRNFLTNFMKSDLEPYEIASGGETNYYEPWGKRFRNEIKADKSGRIPFIYREILHRTGSRAARSLKTLEELSVGGAN